MATRLTQAQETAQYKAILETAVDGIISIDDVGKLVAFNAAAERIFGYSAAEVLGENVRVLMPEPYRGQHDSYLKRYQDTQEARIIGIGREVEGRRKDGSTFPLHLSVGRMEVEGKTFYSGIVRDITRQRQAEIALRESQARYQQVVADADVLMTSAPLDMPLVQWGQRVVGYLRMGGRFDDEKMRRIAVGMSALVFGLSLVMVGLWLVQPGVLWERAPWIFQMHLKTAVLFCLVGGGLLAVLRGFAPWALPAGVFVALLGIVTLAEYMWGMDLGIDGWLTDGYLYVVNNHAGRMAPNTAVALVCSGVALAVMASMGEMLSRSRAVVVDLMAFTMLGIGVAALGGYVGHAAQGYSWGSGVNMAVPTVVLCVLASFAMVASSAYLQRTGVANALWVAPPLLGMLVFLYDLVTPPDVVAGVMYVPLVFCGIWFARAHMTVVLGAMATFLATLGYVLSTPDAFVVTVPLLNRVLSIGVLWLTVALIYMRQRAHERLLDNEARFRNLYNHTPVMLYSTDESGAILSASDYWLEILGYKRGEVVGRQLQSFMTEESRRYFNTTVVPKFRRQGHVKDVACQIVRGDGALVEVMISAISETTRMGKFMRSLAVMVDVTDKAKVEKLLREYADKMAQQNLTLERSNKELENFAYITSHDLQEPLRMVRNYGELLKEKIGDKLDDDGKEFLHYVIDGATRMQQLIRDLLSYSRVGRNEMKIVPVDMGALVEEVRRTLGPSLEGLEAKIVVENKLPVVAGEKGMLGQVMQNLLSNAVKFRKPEGALEIKVSARKLPSGKWEMRVADNGIGMDPRYREKAFEMFKRLHARDKYEGTGIGLAVCKKVVERHGGEIWVETSPGEGSTFYFTLLEKPLTEEKNDEGKGN